MTSSMFPRRTRGSTCHFMLDLETLSTRPDAPILSIGGVLFDPTVSNPFEELRERAILLRIDPADAVTVCGRVDGNTLRWWFSQPDEAIKQLIDGELHSVRDALIKLWRYSHARVDGMAEWHRAAPIPTHIWARSPDFDCKIIESACERAEVRYPFPFYNQRCVRTAIDLAFPNGDAPKPTARGAVRHNAADDAVTQAMTVQMSYAALGLASTAQA
jgi:3' exoribonuclease, RNase T-like